MPARVALKVVLILIVDDASKSTSSALDLARLHHSRGWINCPNHVPQKARTDGSCGWRTGRLC